MFDFKQEHRYSVTWLKKLSIFSDVNRSQCSMSKLKTRWRMSVFKIAKIYSLWIFILAMLLQDCKGVVSGCEKISCRKINASRDELTEFNISSSRQGVTSYTWSGLKAAFNQKMPKSSDSISHISDCGSWSDDGTNTRRKWCFDVLWALIKEAGYLGSHFLWRWRHKETSGRVDWEQLNYSNIW